MTFINKKVLVTGGAGFIGINLANTLSNLGAEVTVIDLPSQDFSSLLPKIEIIKGDLLNEIFIKIIPVNYDYVFHLAAKTDLMGKVIEDYEINYKGTKNLIEVFKKKNKLSKFIFFSTQLTVGLFNETRFINQKEPYKTKTLYGQSKILAEKIVIEKCTQYNIPYIIIRPTSVFGPFGKEPYRDLFLTIKNRQYFHIGKADNLVSLVYVKNLIQQSLILAQSNSKETIFFGNDLYPYTMKEFCSEVGNYFGFNIPTLPYIIALFAAYTLGCFKLIGIKVPLYPFRLRNILMNYCYDISNSVKLGYLPEYTLHQAICETLDWYKANDNEFAK